MDAQKRREALTLLLEEFAESYARKKGALKLREWLSGELREHLPEKSAEEIDAISSDILSNLAVQEEKKVSLEKFTEQGRSKEGWFASELKKDTAGMTDSERDAMLRSMHEAAAKNQADVVNLTKPENAEPVVPEAIPPITNSYQADEAARAIGRKVADNSTINVVISSEVIEAVSQRMRPRNEGYAEVIESELTSGDNTGLKAAAAGAVYTGAESGVIEMPEDDRPVLASAAAFQGVETAEILTRRIPLEETVERLERTGVSVCSGVVSAIKGAKAGAAAGAKIGSAFGWLGSAAGTVIGGLVGGVTGYMAGGRLGDSIVERVQRGRPRALQKAANVLKTVAKSAWEGVKSIGRGIMSIFGF